MTRIISALVLSLLIAATAVQAATIRGKVTAKGAKDAANAVVYIEKVPGKTFQAPSKHPIMDQNHLAFVPHVLPVVAGTTVDFLNSDDVLHNVYTPDHCAGKFNLGSWQKGKTKSFTFKEAGCQPVLLCNVHPEMEGYVVVVETPYFAVTSKDGSYEIKDVPAGSYTVKIWHEKLKGAAQTVSVSGDATANFTIQK